MIACLLAVALASSERFEYRRPLFGVEARAVLWAPDEATADRAASAMWERADVLDRALSDWRDDGALAALARAAGGAPIEVPPPLSRCVEVALEVAHASEGAFDPTIAPLSHLWREARRRGEVPSPDALAAARARVDRHGVLVLADGRMRLAREGLALDLGGVAKGFAAGELARVAEGLGASAVLVELGGDVALGAPPPGRDGWRIEVAGRVLELSNCVVATSGPDEQSFTDGERSWSHVVDPRTGLALERARAATVVHADGAFADALASAATVLSTRAAEELVARLGGARLIHHHRDRTSLFDGETLAGWTTRGGRYDGDARWSVEDGAIVGRVGARGEGGLLYTERLFSAFEFECEVELDYPFDSGLFFHMLPPDTGLRGLQVTLDHRPGGRIAGLYADEWVFENDAAAVRLRDDAWNHVRVRVTGFDPRVEAWIDDVKVLDHTLPDGSAGYARHGRIGLQVHDVAASRAGEAVDRAVRFRGLRVRELPLFGELAGATPRSSDDAPGVRALDTEAVAAGWRELFARGLADTVSSGAEGGHAWIRGVLAVPPDGGGHLATLAHYGDLALSIEYRLAPGANSGLFLRGGSRNPAYDGVEIQWIDDDGWEEKSGVPLLPYQRNGSLYAAAAAPAWTPKARAGEWRRMEVLYAGSRLACALDGLVLFDVDTFTLAAEPAFDQRRRAGFVGVQRYGGGEPGGPPAVEVRNAWILAR